MTYARFTIAWRPEAVAEAALRVALRNARAVRTDVDAKPDSQSLLTGTVILPAAAATPFRAALAELSVVVTDQE